MLGASRTPRLLLALGWATFALAFGVVGAGACSDQPREHRLDPLDLEPNDRGAFNANAPVVDAELTDIETLDRDAVQRFFQKTPYGEPSFLETYQSNGVRAVDAILAAARQYQINPLVFIVFAQISQGLVGERLYPFPVERVEYVFRCGCSHQADCRPEFAGFNRQIDCLGRALRSALDDLASKKATASGWAPGKPMQSLDGVNVVPENDATAALYDRLPRVAERAPGGTWVFWNVWQRYAPALDYGGPVGTIAGRWIGEACASSAACGVENGVCATNYPNGLCTVACTGTCPNQPSKPESFCTKFPGGGFCLPVCNPGSPQCRPGYKCLEVAGASEGTQFVCTGDEEG